MPVRRHPAFANGGRSDRLYEERYTDDCLDPRAERRRAYERDGFALAKRLCDPQEPELLRTATGMDSQVRNNRRVEEILKRHEIVYADMDPGDAFFFLQRPVPDGEIQRR